MSGRSAARSKAGCSTCRTRKVKCDEEHPYCGRCRAAQLSCDWSRPPRRQRPKAGRGASESRDRELGGQQYRLLLPRDAFGCTMSQELSNSLRLSSVDRDYLAYFPNTRLVAWAGKPWKWGMLRYVYSRVASESSVVMRLILAVSASELEGRRSMDVDRVRWSIPCRAGAGVAHYGAALREFRTELERARRHPRSQEQIDQILTAFFFMIAYEQHFGRSCSGLKAHFSGVLAFLKSCGVLLTGPSEQAMELSALSKNLLLYIMYISLKEVRSDMLEHDPMLQAADDDAFCDFLDRLFQESRDTNSNIFRGEYPTEELADDISVYNPLDFSHESSKLHRRLLSYTRDCRAGKEDKAYADFMLHELKRIGRRFNNLIILAQRENPPIRQRELQTIYFGVAEYHAVEIVCHRAICIPRARGSAAACHRDALPKMLRICRRLVDMDPRPMMRVAWPLGVAAETVEDADDKRWVQEAMASMERDWGMPTLRSKMITGS